MKNFTKYSTYIISSLVLGISLSARAFAQSTGSAIQLKNPLAVTSLNDLLLAILNVFMILAVPIIVFFIIYSGFLYVTARGNASQIEQANRSLTYAIIGGVLVIGAVAIAEIVKNLVGSFTTP